MPDELDDAPLTADEILTFGPCVESQVWTPVWVQEARAPIAVAAGRPKLGPVFNSDGVGRIAVIRPCVSRGRAVRGLRPIYVPRMLESNAKVFSGWPMFMDHIPAKVAQTLAARGRSVKDLGGQVLTAHWSRDFTHKDDALFGYQKGSVLAEAWATPFVRKMVGENPNLLHTSISAWPTSGKPGVAPWRPSVKGMVIEGIRSQPQGSVDYVVRGGAGGRLLVAEGLEDEGAWPEVGEWDEDTTSFVVSLAESFYASPAMPEVTLPIKPDELKNWLSEHAPHLLPALAEQSDSDADDKKDKRGKRGKSDSDTDDVREGLTEADVRRLIVESAAGQPSVDDFQAQLEERTNELLAERDAQRVLSAKACKLIESAEGIPATWKQDLVARYTMLPSGPPAALQLAESDLQGQDGATLSEWDALEKKVKVDLEHTRDLIAEAQGKPRVRGEGGVKPDPAASRAGGRVKASEHHWRRRFVEMGLAESEDKAVEAFGGRIEEAAS